MSALLELAKSLGIDPGPLNQADLQEQTCSRALVEIQHWHDQMDKTCEEGCTPADAEKLKGFNAKLAYENFTLKNELDSLAAQAERLKKIPYTKTRSEFMESWCVDGMPFDKKRLVIAAWDRAEWFFNQQAAALKAQWQAEAVQSILDECEHWRLMGTGTWGILVEDISEKLEGLYQREQESGDENNE